MKRAEASFLAKPLQVERLGAIFADEIAKSIDPPFSVVVPTSY
jgi:hypothetical protein